MQPLGAPAANDWAAVEHDIGLVLPADFKRLSERFGCGIFGEDLYLKSPRSRQNQLLLNRESLAQFRTEILEPISFDAPYKLYPDPGGIVTVLSTTCRIHYGFRSVGRLLSSNIVKVDTASGETEDFHLPITEFLLNALEGRLGADFKETIWAEESPFFTPLA
jgi:hypothetical protein